MKKIQGPLATDVRYEPVPEPQYTIQFTLYQGDTRTTIDIPFDREPTRQDIATVWETELEPKYPNFDLFL
jgi:hypothetical protein